MEAHTSPEAAALRCAPYRNPLLDTPTPPPSSARNRALWALSLLSLVATVSTVQLSCALLQATHRVSLARRAVRAVAVVPTLGGAVEDLARRRGFALFVDPTLGPSALHTHVPDALEGTPEASVRALDDYAATQGLWVHLDDGVLRLERAQLTADLHCEDTLDVCATRLERLAAVHIARPDAVASRPVRLHLTAATPALAAVREALLAAGLPVDTVGRTLYVSAPSPTPEPARAASRFEGIRPVGRGVFVVTREALDALTHAEHGPAPGARILPVSRGGQVVGVRVLRVDPEGLPARLGLVSGDVLLRVNGYAVASPDQCLEAYSRLHHVDEIVLDLERNGRPTTLRYLLV